MSKIRFRKQFKTTPRGRKPLGTPFQVVLSIFRGFPQNITSRLRQLRKARSSIFFVHVGVQPMGCNNSTAYSESLALAPKKRANTSKIRFRKQFKTTQRGRKPLGTSFQVVWSRFKGYLGHFLKKRANTSKIRFRKQFKTTQRGQKPLGTSFQVVWSRFNGYLGHFLKKRANTSEIRF